MSSRFKNNFKQVKSTYDSYVRELRQEDSLIKVRLGWFILFEGLLFNMYTQASIQIRYIILVLGSIVACLVLVSLLAAVFAWNDNFRILNTEFVRRFNISEEERINFPQLNRDKKFIWLGHTFALLIPTVVVGVWIFIYIYVF
ncbi:hypothetical protein [Botryobacter ruber]|uniref:hypothetical protein n=1 Tax=Botryobacter ruber TaxID=2171629 RepID=UPI000E0C1DDD|nr:hypothetical protein [Botryobacter ruber]